MPENVFPLRTARLVLACGAVNASANPALQAFVAQFGEELVLAQVLIQRPGAGFALRHVADRDAEPESLRPLPLDEARALAQTTVAGAFRPLRSAPTLRAGWRLLATGEAALGRALEQLYPGAVADWFAAQAPRPPVTDYREFTGRQSGMYRITTMLTDTQAALVTRACCHSTQCLKRRLWTVPGLAPDVAVEKSLIPCLEPCAVLLEFARKAMRIEQDERVPLSLAGAEIESLQAALEFTLAHAPAGERTADVAQPDNPRRLRLLLEKLRSPEQPNAPRKDPADA